MSLLNCEESLDKFCPLTLNKHYSRPPAFDHSLLLELFTTIDGVIIYYQASNQGSSVPFKTLQDRVALSTHRTMEFLHLQQILNLWPKSYEIISATTGSSISNISSYRVSIPGIQKKDHGFIISQRKVEFGRICRQALAEEPFTSLSLPLQPIAPNEVFKCRPNRTKTTLYRESLYKVAKTRHSGADSISQKAHGGTTILQRVRAKEAAAKTCTDIRPTVQQKQHRYILSKLESIVMILTSLAHSSAGKVSYSMNHIVDKLVDSLKVRISRAEAVLALNLLAGTLPHCCSITTCGNISAVRFNNWSLEDIRRQLKAAQSELTI